MYYIPGNQPNNVQRRRQPSISPQTIMKFFDKGQAGGGGSESSSGWSFGTEGSLGTAGWIAAIIALQEILSNNTSTTFEGQRTGDVFDLNFMTEPWLGFAYDKLGFEPSSGEKFDAAVKNSDWGTALKRLPAAANYWAHPGGQLGYELTSNILGEDVAKILNPIEWLINNLSDIF